LALGAPDDVLGRVRRSFGRIDPRTEWPHGLVRFGVAAWIAVTVALGLVYYVRAVDRLGGDASDNAGASYDDRALAGGSALGLDEEALIEARGRIPEYGAYRLVTGPTAENIGQYARYFLMPRRPEPDARWVLCYDCDLAALGAGLRIVWQNDAGVVLGRLPG
jgi:hypothetical protein